MEMNAGDGDFIFECIDYVLSLFLGVMLQCGGVCLNNWILFGL